MTSLEFFTRHLDDYLHDLQRLTAIQTPTGAVEQLGLAADFLSLALDGAATVRRDDLSGWGPLLHLRRAGTGQSVLLLGHVDTVWPPGSWSQLWRIEDGRVFAPGVYDMKGGVLFIVWVLRYLAGLGREHAHIEALLSPNEEVGSPDTRPIIEDAARRADAVLVLEPTNLDGSLKLARKGSGEYTVTIQGRSAHQGVAPESGVNAVVEAGHQVLRLLQLQDPGAGTTIGPNVIRGGTMSNVVPDRAEIRVDVRAWTSAEVERLEREVHRLEPQVAGARIDVDGGWNRPPMETTPASIKLYEHVRAIGRGLGLDLGWVRWGGSSDANLTAAIGAPTIDGFGPVGDGAHQLDECIVIDRVPERLALLAEVLQSLGSKKLRTP